MTFQINVQTGGDDPDKRLRELASELAADMREKGDTRARLAKAAQAVDDNIPSLDGPAWADKLKGLLADSIALGRELDRTNFYRDPKVGLALELAYEALKDKGAALPSFVAELLEISLRNAKNAPHYYDNDRSTVYFRDANQALADSSWARRNQEKAAVVGALIKAINDRPLGQFDIQPSQHGRAVAREAWKTIEPRAAFWEKPGAKAASAKFAGKTPAQIMQDTNDLAKKINEDCDEQLRTIYGRSDLQKSAGTVSSFTANESRPIFAPIVKVDVARREVHGVMAEETPDKAKEIFDYASSKPHIQKWAEQFQKATDGKSVGNVRAMHSNISAGKLISIHFDDANKRIPIVAKVVDDNEWKKVLEGIYTGFSIGGKYLKRWADGEHQRYTAQPSEVSLVDNPCMYGATFTAIKTDGSRELRKFAGGSDANGILRKTAETCEQIERDFNAKLAKIYR
jgi:hypothetical protein